MRRKKKPEPQFYENITLLASGGEGHALAKIENKVIFVKYGAPGDVVDIRIIGRKKRHSIAIITAFKERSTERQDPFCAHYEICGGCKWQHILYPYQAAQKEQWAKDCLERIGKIAVTERLPILTPSEVTYYRNKMEYTFSNKKWLLDGENEEATPNLNALGFHATGRFDKVVHINHCWLQDDKANIIRNFVFEFAIAHEYTFYDLKLHEGFLRNLTIRNTTDGQWMIILAVASNNPAWLYPLLDAIDAEFNPTSLFYVINEKKNDTIYDQELLLYKGAEMIVERLCGLDFYISPKSFFQTNTKQAEVLYQVALDFADIQPSDVVYDLYCGTGTLTLASAKFAKTSIGVEIVPEAIEMAQRNAEKNEIENAVFVTGDMKDVFNQGFYGAHGKPDIIITDPPRSGMHPGVIAQLLSIKCPKIVYISCNPATQARDLAMLDAVYECKKAQAVDMFPQTHHTEQVVFLTLR